MIEVAMNESKQVTAEDLEVAREFVVWLFKSDWRKTEIRDRIVTTLSSTRLDERNKILGDEATGPTDG